MWVRGFFLLLLCFLILTAANAVAEDLIFANYFDIQESQGEGSEVFGRLHLKSNKDVRANPIPSGYQFEIVSANSDPFELVTQRDAEGRIFGILRVRAGENSGAASDHSLSVALKNGSSTIATSDIVIHVVEQTLWSKLLDYYRPITMLNVLQEAFLAKIMLIFWTLKETFSRSRKRIAIEAEVSLFGAL